MPDEQAPTPPDIVLELRKISKRFGPLVANDGIDLVLRRGEVLALLGENGAGKTTLMNILFGHYVADGGEVRVFGRRLKSGRPGEAIRAGVGMVHQHFTLAENLTVLENVIAGVGNLWALGHNTAGAVQRLKTLADDFGLEADPAVKIANLTVGQRQRVEILKALYRSAKILILDEPTAVLTPQEADSLFLTLKRLVGRGLSVILISHKLNEVMAASDRIVVLRRGRTVADRKTRETHPRELAQEMVGRAVIPPRRQPLEPGAPVVELRGVSLRSPKKGHQLTDIDLQVRSREIVGIAGVSGNGQVPLGDLMCGLRRPAAGRFEIYGQPAGDLDPGGAAARGIGRIPEDRISMGLIGEMSIEENVISERYGSPTFSKRGVLRRRAIRDYACRLIEKFDVRCPGPRARAGDLSGGNLQKILLARALDPEPKLILANQPTRGLDVGAIVYVHQCLLDARQRGAGILLISEDLDELFQLADRIVVLYQGRASPSWPVEAVSKEQIGLMMSGHVTGETMEA